MVAPATWNRHPATIQSFLRYAARHGILPELRVELDRRREPADRTRALPEAALERLWTRRDIPPPRQHAVAAALRDRRTRQRGALAQRRRSRPPARRAVIRGKNGELDYLQ